MCRIFLIVLFVLLVSGCTRSHLEIFPPLSDPKLMEQDIPVAKLHADVDAFVEGIKLRHPDYARYANTKAVEAKVAEIKQAINQPMNRVEFFKQVGQLSHLFNDGHSFLIWPYQEFQALQEAGHKPFPFALEINSQGVFLKHRYQNGEQVIERGARLTVLNGLPIKNIIELGQKYVGGETRRLREHIVVSRFPRILWAVFGFVDDFELTLVGEGNTTQLEISKEQNWEVAEQQAAALESDFYYKKLHDKVGYLYVGTFDIDPDWFADFIDETFVTIRQQNVTSLIVDIRNNGGGNTDSALYLSQYLANKPFRMVSSVKEKLNHQNRGWFNYKGQVGELLEQDWNDWHQPKNESLRFQGKSYLLVGTISYSSAIVFATTVQDNQFATLIGQETGGFANQTGQGNLFNLPHSELRAYVPTRLLVRPSGDEKVSGVVPEVVTQLNASDIAAGIDTEIQAALKLSGAIIEAKDDEINAKSSN